MKVPKNTKSLIILLNDLARINNDRVEGYDKASRQAEADSDLSSLFYEKSKQSEGFITELTLCAKELGGHSKGETSLSGKIFRLWMAVKNTVKPNDATSILDSCEYGEQAAIKAYDAALRSDIEIPAVIRQEILEQQTAIRKTCDLIRKYRDLHLRVLKYNQSFTL